MVMLFYLLVFQEGKDENTVLDNNEKIPGCLGGIECITLIR